MSAFAYIFTQACLLFIFTQAYLFSIFTQACLLFIFTQGCLFSRAAGGKDGQPRQGHVATRTALHIRQQGTFTL